MNNKSSFILEIRGVSLKNLNSIDLGRLLEEFSKLLGRNEIYLDGIYFGSGYIKLYTENKLYAKKLEQLSFNTKNNHKSLVKIERIIRSYSRHFPYICSNILASKTSRNEDAQILCSINHSKPQSHYFEQEEFFVGKLLKPAHGKDETDHFTILLSNEDMISVKLSKQLSTEIAPYLETLWNHASLIRFLGIARYEVQDSYEVSLKEFNASSFDVIKRDTDICSWVAGFVYLSSSVEGNKKCQSGWNNHKDPQSIWIKERQK